jgi:hypothetical protein
MHAPAAHSRARKQLDAVHAGSKSTHIFPPACHTTSAILTETGVRFGFTKTGKTTASETISLLASVNGVKK